MPFEYYPNFISEEEEKTLLDFIYNEANKDKWEQRFTERRMQTYGYQYKKGESGENSIVKTTPIPDIFNDILKIPFSFNQLTINEYLPGQGIDAHYDHKIRFGNHIGGITLNGGCEFILKSLSNKDIIIKQYLEPRSFYIMSDEERYEWTHEIKRVHFDMVNDEVIKRNTRISCTLRNVII